MIELEVLWMLQKADPQQVLAEGGRGGSAWVPEKPLARSGAPPRWGTRVHRREVIAISCPLASTRVPCRQSKPALPTPLSLQANHCVQLLEWFDYRGHVCMVFERLGPSIYDYLRKNSYKPFPLAIVRG